MSKPTATIRVLLVDDHFFVRSGVKVSLEAEGDLQVVAEADSTASAVEQYRQHQPDVTLMDGNLPDGSGIQAITEIRAEFPQARIIMLTINETVEDVYQAVAAGATGYLTKSSGRKEMLHAIREAARGKRYFPQELAARLNARRARPELTTRETEVLQHVVAGTPNKNIADALGCTEQTIKNHLSHIFAKLGVQDRTSATVTALRRGLVRLE